MSLRLYRPRCFTELASLWLRYGALSRQISSTTSLHRKTKTDKTTKDDSDDVSSSLKSAVKSVAKSLPGNSEKTESVLLKQLRTQAKVAKDLKDGKQIKSDSQMSSLLSSMKVNKERSDMRTDFPRGQAPLKSSPQDRKARLENIKLFGGPGLGIFKKKANDAQPSVLASNQGKSLWDEVEEESLDRLAMMPPENAFEEMIQMTKEGKLWTFPINNEAGMIEEQNIGFHEHVFLERHLQDFPHRGPIRHFMELVTTGLSKNPHLSVEQKLEHIDWFRTYFKNKQEVLEENLGPDGVMKSFTDNQLQ